MRAPPSTTPSLGRAAIGGLGLCVATAGVAPGAMAQAAATTDPDHGENTPKVGEVVVSGLRPLLGDKLPLTVQNAPQSVNIVTDRLMREQGATRLEDALKNVPGITLNAGEGAARGDTINIRGFSAFNDFFLDGVRDAAVYNRDDFDTETVEVIKGPSAVLFGRGSTGGAINQVTKAPRLGAFADAALELGTNEDYRATADLDAPIGDAAAVRLDAMGETSHVADRDYVKNRRWGLAPSVSLGLGRPTTLTVSWLHQQEDDVPDVGIPFLFGAPAPVPPKLFYGLASDRTTTRDDILTVRLRHDFSPTITLADTFRYGNYGFDYRFDSPNFGDDPPAPGTPLSQILVGRDSPSSLGTQTNLTDQLDLTLRFSTGPLSHTVVVGVEAARETTDISRSVNPFDDDTDWVAPTPLLDPNPLEARPNLPVETQEYTVAYSQAAFVTDTIAIGRHVDIIAAARFDRFEARYDELDVLTGARLRLDHVDNLFSPRLAIVYKPTLAQSVYVSYGTSFEPSAEALTLTPGTADLGPVRAKTYEAGAKTSWLGGAMLLTAAVFRTEVDNAQTNDPDNPTITVLNGDERVDGFELGASGRVGPLELTAGYTWLDARTLRSGDPQAVGKVMPNAARNAVNVWAEYEITERWEVGVGGNYLGARWADPDNTASVPGYVVVNAMTSYQVTPHLTLQINGLNLADRRYYDGFYYTDASENHVVPGPGRTVKLTARVRF
jgi:catecholate siderophore receptor